MNMKRVKNPAAIGGLAVLAGLFGVTVSPDQLSAVVTLLELF